MPIRNDWTDGSTGHAGDLNDIANAVNANTTAIAGKQPLDADLTALAALTSPAAKLSGIEAAADVTDAANVDAAGAVMNTDTSTAAMAFVIDEDSMGSNTATKVPTQQSVKAYVDARSGGGGTAWTAAPATSTSTGTQGQLAADDTWLYVCTATNTWGRVALDSAAFPTAASAPPKFETSAYSGAASTNSVVVNVPSGVEINDVVLVSVWTWPDVVTITPASGFTLVPAGAAETTDGTMSLRVYWKRLTAADTGTYTFGLSGVTNHTAIATRYSGCIDTGTPFDVDVSAVNETWAGSPPTVSLTTTVDNTRLIYAGACIGGSVDPLPPTGFTIDETGDTISVSSEEWLTAAATGTLSASGSWASDFPKSVWMGALIGGEVVPDVYAGPAPSYFSTWSNGPGTSDTFFPIGIWQTDLRSTAVISPYSNMAQAIAAANISIAMASWTWLEEPAPSPYNYVSLAATNGIKLIPSCIPGNTTDPDTTPNTAYLAAHPEHAGVIIGWNMGDEPCMYRSDQFDANSSSTWYSKYLACATDDPTRPIHTNFGKTITTNATTFAPGVGAGWDTGSLAGDMAQWMQSCDTASADTYWWSDDSERGVDPHRCYAYRYGWNIDNMRKVTTNRAMPLWGFVETCRPQGSNTVGITPTQLEAAVWQMIVHGARGIMYFNVDFGGGGFVAEGPWASGYFDHTAGNAVIAKITSVNARLLGLAQILNTPELGSINSNGREVADGYVTVSTTGGIPVDVMVREFEGVSYVFAQASGDATTHYASGSTTATFTWHAADSGSVTVRDESRTVTMTSGVWSDTFTAYQLHIYILP